MVNELQDVKEFMTTFGQEVPKFPSILDKETINLRINTILEELCELNQAAGGNIDDLVDRIITIEKPKYKDKPATYDIVEILDALIDLEYFVKGSVLAFGLKETYVKGWRIVHKNNMTKAFDKSKLEDAEFYNKTVEQYPNVPFITIHHVEDKAMFKHGVSGKVLKPYGYTKVDLADAFSFDSV